MLSGEVEALLCKHPIIPFQAVSMAEMAGVDLQHICQAATWTSSSTFAKYYRLNLMAKAHLDFGRRMLRLAGPSRRLGGTGSLLGYLISKKSRHPH